MAVTYLSNFPAAPWDNADGLRTQFGLNEAQATRAGVFEDQAGGGDTVIEVLLDLTKLPTVASGDQAIIAENIAIPSGAFLKQITVLVTKETTTSSGTLNVGTVAGNRTTLDSATSILSALASVGDGTDLGEFTTVVKGSTSAGTKIGTVTTAKYYMVASASTADFTAGVVQLRLHYWMPVTATGVSDT